MTDNQNPARQTKMTGDDVNTRSRMQISPGYLNSFETVISALKSGGKQAQDAGHVAHGACLLHAAVELEAVFLERAAPKAGAAEWKLVPIEPTPEMVNVGTEARWRSAIRDADSVREIYRHMLDTAPTAKTTSNHETEASSGAAHAVSPSLAARDDEGSAAPTLPKEDRR